MSQPVVVLKSTRPSPSRVLRLVIEEQHLCFFFFYVRNMMNVYAYEQPATVGVLLMFIVSGLSKMSPSQFDVQRSQEFFRKIMINLPRSYVFYMVMVVGLFELVASGVILHDVFLDKENKGRLSSRSEIAVLSLLAFTVLVTFMFYVSPMKVRALLSNISTVAGLAFVYQIVVRNSIQREAAVSNETIQRVEKVIKNVRTSLPKPQESPEASISQLPEGNRQLSKGSSSCGL